MRKLLDYLIHYIHPEYSVDYPPGLFPIFNA